MGLPFRRLFLLAWALLLFTPALSPAATPHSVSSPSTRQSSVTHRAKTQRYVIYMLGSRVGTSTVSEAPVTYQGRQALQVDAKTEMKVTVLASIEQKIDLRQLLDPTGHPLTLTMTMSSGGHATRVDARFTASQVECTVDSGGSRSVKNVPIPAGVTLIADPDQIGPKTGEKLKPGTKMRLYTFEPVTLQIMPLDLEVLPSETLSLGGKSYRATVVKATTPMTGESKSWVDDKGDLLQQEGILGLKMVREDLDRPDHPAGAAPQTATAYVPPPDFAVATSIRTKTVITRPRAVTFLRLRVDGIPDENLVLRDARQSAELTHPAGKLSVVYTIRADKGVEAKEPGVTGQPSKLKIENLQLKVDNSPPTPTPNPQPPTPNPYLATAPYLEVDDPRIQQQAREIAGDATEPLEKARRIRAWVHAHMTPKMNIGVVRAATDVLKDPVGVCRDYAVLFTALARAAGVPARVCGGIVYFRDGFYYHAWSEVQAGSSDWVAFDATLPADFVDATHLKFAQGDPTAMFQAVRVVGRLKAEVLEYH